MASEGIWSVETVDDDGRVGHFKTVRFSPYKPTRSYLLSGNPDLAKWWQQYVMYGVPPMVEITPNDSRWFVYSVVHDQNDGTFRIFCGKYAEIPGRS